MSRPHTVLIIQADPRFGLTLTAYLEDSGYVDLEAGNGLEGLKTFTRARPDIVLTDLRMPVLDGFGVITAIKRQSSTTPVIALTGTGDPRAPEDTLRLGAWGRLSKPVEDSGILEAALARAVEDAGEQT
jgi:CheY-like chemotaxis protein